MVALPLVTAAVFALISWKFLSGIDLLGPHITIPRYYLAPVVLIPLFYATVLIFISVADIKYQVVIPIVVNVALIMALAASFIWFDYWPGAPAWPGHNFASAIFGMVIGAITILIPHVITGGRGVGFGDVMIGALAGVITGFPLVIVAVVFGWGIGILAAIFLLIKRKKAAIPFGPYLAAGALITLLWGPQIYHWLF
jgi:leader peptidase (prepilin peptidase)/N-methyltransferase